MKMFCTKVNGVSQFQCLLVGEGGKYKCSQRDSLGCMN